MRPQHASTDPCAPRALPVPSTITVLYRDEALVVIDKPSGLAVHRGDDRGKTFALNLTRDAVGQWVYPVHRLDRGTSGVLVFALSSAHARALQDAFQNFHVKKSYLALVRGVPLGGGVIDTPMAKRSGATQVPAETAYRTLYVSDAGLSLVEAQPKTGRRHQIRRHFKRIHHPVAGDVNYGKGADNRRWRLELGLYRLALHARRLSFPHPVTGARLTLWAPVPPSLAKPFSKLGVPRELLSV